MNEVVGKEVFMEEVFGGEVFGEEVCGEEVVEARGWRWCNVERTANSDRGSNLPQLAR